MRYILFSVVSIVISAAVGCAKGERSSPRATDEAEATAPQAESIGQAWLEDDGTLKLQLRAEGEGAMGDSLLVYSPGDEKYESTLRHIGGLKKGEVKPVPPWPDDEAASQDSQ